MSSGNWQLRERSFVFIYYASGFSILILWLQAAGAFPITVVSRAVYVLGEWKVFDWPIQFAASVFKINHNHICDMYLQTISYYTQFLPSTQTITTHVHLQLALQRCGSL